MIDIHFTLTQAEYLEAQKLYMKRNRTLTLARWILLGILLAGITIFAFASPDGFDSNARQQFAPAFIVVLVLLSFPLLQKYAFKKRFLQEKQNLTDAHLIMDDAGYHMDVPGIGGGVAEWGGMDGWLEGTSVIVLRSGLLMRLFPKASLSDSQLQEARSLLTTKLGPAGTIRKR